MLRNYILHYRQLLNLAMPLVLTQAGQISVLLIDNAMVGHVGTSDLAAASFANSIHTVIMLFGLGVFLGVTPLVSHARGGRNDSQVASIIKNGFALSGLLLLGITLASLVLVLFMPYMGQTDKVVHLAIPYYYTLVASTIPFLIFVLLKQIGEGLGNTVMAMAATIAAIIVNVALNYILIFGKLGFPRLGLLGAGCATLTARITMPLLLYAGFLTIRPIRHYFELLPKTKVSLPEIKKIFAVGLPIATQLVLEVSAFSFSAIMMGWLGDVPLASHQVAMGLATFTFMIANGVAMATTIRVSFQLGTGNFKDMERVSYSAVHLALGFMGICGLGFIALRHQLPHIFSVDPRVITLTASLLIIAGLFQALDGLQIVCLGILRGFADVKVPMFISAFSYIGIGLPVSYLCAFTFHMGPEGIWYGFFAGLIAAGTQLSLRIRKNIHELEAGL